MCMFATIQLPVYLNFNYKIIYYKRKFEIIDLLRRSFAHLMSIFERRINLY